MALTAGAIEYVFDRWRSINAGAVAMVFDRNPAADARLYTLPSQIDRRFASEEFAHSFDNVIERWAETKISLEAVYDFVKRSIAISKERSQTM